MAHLNIERLTEYWRAKSDGSGAPPRVAVDPADFAVLWPQTFMLGRVGPADYAFRLAGGLVEDLHGGSLRGQAFGKLFAEAERRAVLAALESARRQGRPLVLTLQAIAGAGAMSVEIVLLPLSGADGTVDRILGLYQPTSPVLRLYGQPVEALHLAQPLPQAAAHLRLAVVEGQRVA